MRHSKLTVACSVFGVWTVFGFLLGQQVYALRAGATPTWGQSLAFELSYCYTWALLTPLVWRLRRWFPLESSRWWRRIPIHVAAGLVMAAAAQTGEILILRSLHTSWFPQPSGQMMMRSIFMTLDYGSVLYWVVLLTGQSFEYLRRHSLDQVQKAELKRQLAESQLQALRMQMHPHFLFNALNSLSELIHDNPKEADRMVGRLSELLRIFLRSSETQEVRLDQEVDFLERYLEIQKIRFEERVRVKIKLDPRTLGASVPSLILQPLVENAIRHGIADREDEGWIEIQSTLENGRVRLRVADNGAGHGERTGTFVPEGTGLRNTRRRLRTIYATDYDFRVANQALGGVEAVITIPLKPMRKASAA